MKKTLLQMVQNIMSSMDSDEINSISDTVEGEQVAEIIQQVYWDMMSNRNWPHLKQLIQFDSSLDIDKPTHFKLPEDIKELVWVKYNKQRVDETRVRVEPVRYKHPEEFVEYVARRDNDLDEIIVVEENGIPLLIRNDKQPEFWTSFDDEYIIFDSYDSEVEATLQNSKIVAQAYMAPSFAYLDDFVPDLPPEGFSKLIAESKSIAFIELKQVSHDKAEQISQRQDRWLSRKAWSAKGGITFEDYGRKRNTYRGRRRDVTFERDQ